MEVYLDTAATSRRKPEEVYRAMDRFMREVGASPGRSVHSPGIEAGNIVADVRAKLAKLFGVPDASRFIFTLNCTEALNLAIKGILKTNDHIVTSSMEHNSIMRPLSALMQERSIKVSRAKADRAGIIDPDDLAANIRPETKLIVMTHASNVTGAIQPIETVGQIAKERDIPFLLDAAQTVGCYPINLSRLPVDIMAFSGHKSLMGPQGVGGLYIREGIDLVPLKQGGTGSASSEEFQPQELPDKYESGTPNTPGIAGLSAAIDFVSSVSVDKIRTQICQVGKIILEGLQGMDGITYYGPGDMKNNVGIFSFTVEGRDSAEVADDLESRYGIMTRVGLHCAPSAHRTIGTFPQGAIRAGIGYFSTEEEAKYLIQSLGPNYAPTDSRCIVVFPSTHYAIQAERAAHKASIPIRMIPVPRRISPDCNMGMEVSIDRRDSLQAVLAAESIKCNLVTWRK